MLVAPDDSVKRVLVIAPHADDEVIGCGGFLALATAKGLDVTLVIMATGGIKHHHLATIVETQDRLSELEAACRILAITRSQVLFPEYDMRLEEIPMLRMVTALDEILSASAFDECYIPESSHNRDHQMTHEAAIAAMRPSGRRLPGLLACFEGTISDLRSGSATGGMLYVNIESTMEKKVAALQAYKSQIRSYPHPISEEAMRRLAAMRGLECGMHCAERYRILRMIRS